MRVGLTGGIGSGKSAVAAELERLGALVIDTDLLAREAIAPGSEGYAQVANAWPQVVGAGGAIDRAALAEIVFADPQARERLNAIVHPAVRALAARREAQASPRQLIVHVVPLLFETGYDQLVDRSVAVFAPDDVRVTRVSERDDASPSHVRARMAAQIAPSDARARADFTIENDGTLEELCERTRSLYEMLTKSA